jgi:diaminopropionate ammonia-lyase
LAETLKLSAIYVKDESCRLGLGSFKALGGSYAAIRIVLEHAGRVLGGDLEIEDLDRPHVRAVAATMTLACATDGNHGRSVAQGAQIAGANCVIFVHSGVSAARVQAIEDFGARTIRVPGTYDDSVVEATKVCAANGWTTVSDTSWPGYERIPTLVMQGYTVLMDEVMAALPQKPTHVFIQAGVGGLAATVAAYLAVRYQEGRPILSVVEPDRAACIYESIRAGELIKIDHRVPTVMAMLECYEPSLVAWRIITRAADAFVAITEDDAIRAMNSLARPIGADPAIISGESGGAGLAGLAHVCADPAYRAALRLDADSVVLVVNTEGATDPDRYFDLVGIRHDELEAVRKDLS